MKLNTKAHIALGQTSLLVTLLLVAVSLGLIPDRHGAVREGRAALAESIAANSSMVVSREDTRRLRSILDLIVERNSDLLSAALRRAGGEAVATVGDHLNQWNTVAGGYSTDSQISVPIWSGEQRWGQVELRFRPLTRIGWLGVLDLEWVRLIAFVAFVAFAAFYVYLGRTLRHLDPNRAVPPHVRSALDTLAEGLLILDLRGNIVLANSAFADVTGQDADELIGRSASQILWTDARGRPLDDRHLPWRKTLDDGAAQRNDPICVNTYDNRRLSFQVNCSPVLGSEGKHGGVLITFEDITELEENKKELHKSKEEADSANRAKSEFLANMSHEIRTPMNAILGFTEVLRRGFAKSEADQKKHLNTIHSSGKHLLQLINDVLDLSKVEAGRLDVEQIEVASHQLLKDVVKVMSVKAEEKGISLDFDVVGRVPSTIRSDPTRLRQIMTNLLGNSIKFTDHGGVKVVLQLASSSDAQRLVIDVIDSGVGMAEDKLESIFEAFVQADSSVTRQFGGTGLGLAISRKFARALGGDIVVKSEVGKGSVFTVLIDPGPLENVDFIDAETARSIDEDVAESATGQWQFPPANVLVVDDGEENRELIKIVLGDVGLRVEGAENGKIGVEKALAGDVDVVLMDMQMPVMDGREATTLLRRGGFEKPIIALTANAMKGFEKECLQLGCTGYLPKPVDVDELIRLLAALLEGTLVQSSEVSAGARPETLTEAPYREPRAPSTSATANQVAGDDRFQRIQQKFAGRLDEKMTEIETAWTHRDCGQLASLAHWLKGSAGTVGFNEFFNPSKTLEQLAKNEGDDAAIQHAIDELRTLTNDVVRQFSGDCAVSKARTPASPGAVVAPPTVAGTDRPAYAAVSPVTSIDPRLRRIRTRFTTRLQQQVSAAETAWDEQDVEALLSFGHWLKGSAGTVGFKEFCEPAKQLENQLKAGDELASRELLNTIRRLADNVFVTADKEAV